MSRPHNSYANLVHELEPTGYHLSIAEEIEQLRCWRDLDMAAARSFRTTQPEWASLHVGSARRYQHQILELRAQQMDAALDEVLSGGDDPEGSDNSMLGQLNEAGFGPSGVF